MSMHNGVAAERSWQPETLFLISWRHKGWLALGLLLGIAGSAAVWAVLPRSYQSSAQIAVVKKYPDGVTGFDNRNTSAEETVAPLQDLLKSTLIIDGAIRAKQLDTLPSLTAGDTDLTERVRNALTVASTKAPAGQNSLVYKLTCRSSDSADCRTVLTAILDSYREFLDRKHQAVSQDTIDLILREKQALEKEIAARETAYQAFRETAPLLGKGKDGLELGQERLNSIQARRSTLLLQRVELEGQLAAVERALKEGQSQEAILAMVADFTRKGEGAEPGRDRQISMQDQLLPLLLEERKLLELHGPNHPEVVGVRKRIDAARRLLALPATAWRTDADAAPGKATAVDDPIGLHVQVLRQKLSHVAIAEEMLAKVFQTEQDEARRLASYEIQNDAFHTSIALHQQLYEALVKRLTEVNLIKNAGGYQIEMIDPPSAGRRVSNLALTLGLGALAGLVVGLALALRADSRIAGGRSVNATPAVTEVPNGQPAGQPEPRCVNAT